jgi:hypothetical protein
MGTFGRYLLERGVVSAAQLEEATQVMVVFGGRLGTVLVEAGALTLEQVERHLSAHLDVPVAPRERLERPALDALEAIPADLVRRHRVFPMWLEKRTLHVAMSEPKDANRIDELAFVTSLCVKPYAIAERRLVQLLERYYGIRPDSRFTDYHLLEMAGHVRPRRRPPGPQTEPIARQKTRPRRDDAVLHERAALGISPLGAGEELCPREEPDERQAQGFAPPSGSDRAEHGTTGGPAPATSPAQVAELESELVLLAKPGAVPTLVLRIASFYVLAAAFFVVRSGTIHGLLAAGDVPGSRVEDVHLPVPAPSLLSAPISSGSFSRGRPPSEGVDAEILRLLARNPRELAVFPIRLDDRTVSLLYADNGTAALAESSIAALEALCQMTAAAYERLLLASRNYI